MVAMTAQGPQLRPARDPARPVGDWVPVLLVAAGVLLSLLGWATADRLAGLQESAARNAAVAAAADRDATLAADREQRATNEAAALAALVVYRCDTGTIRDAQVCDTARRLR